MSAADKVIINGLPTTYLSLSGGNFIGTNIGWTVNDGGLNMYGATDNLYGSGTQFYGRDHATQAGNMYINVGGYDSIGSLFLRAGGTSAWATLMTLDYKATLSLASGTAPVASVADTFLMYSKDIVAGNAAPHFRSEAGNIVKLYTQAFIAGPSRAARRLSTRSERFLINSGQMAES